MQRLIQRRILYITCPYFNRILGDSPGRIGLLEKKKMKDMKVFFSLNIFIIKQSMLLTLLRLLRIVSSGD